MPLWFYLAAVALGVGLFIIVLCRAAANGDRILQDARRNLAGPEDRERVGIRRRGS